MNRHDNLMNSDFRNGDRRALIDNPTSIYITPKTLTFESHVFQTPNITGFEATTIKLPNIFPVTLILLLWVGAILTICIPQVRISAVLAVLAIAGTAVNNLRPYVSGLNVYFNSGDKILFVCRDIKNIKDVVKKISSYLDGDNFDKILSIHIDRKTISCSIQKIDEIKALEN